MKYTGYKILLCVVILAAVAPIFLGEFYAAGDTRDVFIPLETFFHQEELKLRLPAWDPNISWGFPIIAAAQIGFFYPPLLLTRWLPIWVYLPLNLAGHLIATALGTFLFLRQLGRSNSAAYLGAISFTLGAFIFQHLTHLNITFAIAWFPWQILMASKFTLSSSKGNLARLAFLLGVPFLAGQIQIPLLMALVTCAYAIKAWKKLFWVGILAFGLAAAQLFPTAELAWHSTRGQNSDFDIERANQYSWPLYHLPTLLFPRFFGNDTTYWGKPLQIEYGFFIGTIPLLLALSSFGFRHSSLRFWKWITIISFLLALGSLSPFRLLKIEPSLWFFSAPARWLLFTTFGLSALAAYGWDNIWHNKRRRPQASWKWLAIGVITFVVVTNLALIAISTTQLSNVLSRAFNFVRGASPETFASSNEYYTEKMMSLLHSLHSSSVSLLSPYTALPIILLAAMPLVSRRRFGKYVLLAAISTELVIVAAAANPAFSWREILREPEIVSSLPTLVRKHQARLYTLRDFEDTGALLTNPGNRPFDRFHNEPRKLLLPLIHAQFGLPGVVWPASLDLSDEAKVLHNLNESLKNGDITLAEELNIGVVLLPSPQILSPRPRAEFLAESSADYQEIDPTHIQITTNSEKPNSLLVRDTFYPGWHATLDSTRRVESGRAGPNGIFRAISVPAGSHTITMDYKPTLLYVGITISLVSLLLALLFVLVINRLPLD